MEAYQLGSVAPDDPEGRVRDADFVIRSEDHRVDRRAVHEKDSYPTLAGYAGLTSNEMQARVDA